MGEEGSCGRPGMGRRSSLSARTEAAELLALAAMLADVEGRPELFGAIEPEDFDHEGRGAVWARAKADFLVGRPVNPIALRIGTDHGEVVDAALKLRDTAEVTATAQVVDQFRSLVALRRVEAGVRQVAAELPQVGAASEDVQNVAVALQQVGDAALQAVDGTATKSLGDEMAEWHQAVERGLDTPIATWGLTALDAAVRGIRPSEIHVPIGRTGGGKSSLAMTAAHATEAMGNRVLYVSLEMTVKSIGQRFVAMNVGRDPQEIRNEIERGRLSREDIRKHIPKRVEVTTTLRSVADIATEVRRARAAHDPYRLVVVDYLQLLEGPGESATVKLDTIMKDLIAMAALNECAVIAPAQVNREGARSDDAPKMSEIRGSGAIEQGATSVISIHRAQSAMHDGDARYADAYFDVQKSRNGVTGNIETPFKFGLGTFCFWHSMPPWRGDSVSEEVPA